MNQISKAAIELVAEMERQGRSEAVLYTLDPTGGFHQITDIMKCLDVLVDIEGEVDMCIGSLTIEQLRAIGELG